MDRFKKNPLDVQSEVLFKLIERAKNTEWGLKHRFKSIFTIQDFQKRVAIQNYESLKPYIERIMNGENNILWPGEIAWFAKSSGTTSDKSKFIPVTDESLEDNHYRGARDIINVYLSIFPDSLLLKGKGLTLGGSHQINKFNERSSFGDLSAILIDNAPFWVSLFRIPKVDIALMNEWESKLKQITLTAIKENVTSISGVPSWNMVLIKHILNYTGKNNLLEIWPNLELFIHGGVSFTPYRDQYKKMIPSNSMNYMETYNASEGFFALQDDLSRDDMMLLLDAGIFYEFVPLDEIYKENPIAYNIEDVSLDVQYAIVISTNSGLWRYMIGDTVVFTSLYPHRIKISGRTVHFLNVFGEELIVDNAEKALRYACEKTNAAIADYSAAPIFMNENQKGTHEWVIEFNKKPENILEFTNFLDQKLMTLNSDYEAKRYKNITLTEPVITVVKNGVFYKWFEQKGKLGGQNKIPRLFNQRNYVNELIEINKTFV